MENVLPAVKANIQKVLVGEERVTSLLLTAMIAGGHVLIEDGYPHHGAVAFGDVGKYLYEIFKWLGVTKISFNQPKGMLYPTENPFEK